MEKKTDCPQWERKCYKCGEKFNEIEMEQCMETETRMKIYLCSDCLKEVEN